MKELHDKFKHYIYPRYSKFYYYEAIARQDIEDIKFFIKTYTIYNETSSVIEELLPYGNAGLAIYILFTNNIEIVKLTFLKKESYQKFDHNLLYIVRKNNLSMEIYKYLYELGHRDHHSGGIGEDLSFLTGNGPGNGVSNISIQTFYKERSFIESLKDLFTKTEQDFMDGLGKLKENNININTYSVKSKNLIELAVEKKFYNIIRELLPHFDSIPFTIFNKCSSDDDELIKIFCDYFYKKNCLQKSIYDITSKIVIEKIMSYIMEIKMNNLNMDVDDDGEDEGGVVGLKRQKM